MTCIKSLSWKWIKRCCLLFYPYLILLIITLCILWVQICNKSFILSGDSLFHVNQFYESAMQIKTGQFNWFLNLFSFGQAGRIVNAIYGPAFSYLVGALLLFVGTWSKAQLVLEFIITFLSGAFMYHLLRFVGVHRVISLMLGIVYASSYPITSFMQEQSFEGIGNVFIPLVILLGVKMWQDRQVPIIPLAVLLAVIMQIHILTAVVSTLALLPFVVVSFIRSSRKWCWLGRISTSGLLFLLLTGNIWSLVLNVFHSNYIIGPYPNEKFVLNSLFFNNGQLSFVGNLYIFIVLLLVALLIINWRHLSWRWLFIPLLAILYTFVSSAYFPWVRLNRMIPKIGQLFQFPFRFLGVAIVLILLALGQNLNQLLKDAKSSVIKKILTALGLVGLLMITFTSVVNERDIISNQINKWNSGLMFRMNYRLPANDNQLKSAFISKCDLGLAPRYLIKTSPDYLPTNRPLPSQDYFHIAPYSSTMMELNRERPIYYSFRSRALPRSIRLSQARLLIEPNPSFPHFHKFIQGHHLIIEWHQPKSLNNKYTILPAVKYYHTQVKMDHRSLRHFKLTKVGAIDLRPSTGYHQVMINYYPAEFVLIMMILTIISWLIIIADGIFRVNLKLCKKILINLK